jgi:hypothetical protein
MACSCDIEPVCTRIKTTDEPIKRIRARANLPEIFSERLRGTGLYLGTSTVLEMLAAGLAGITSKFWFLLMISEILELGSVFMNFHGKLRMQALPLSSKATQQK